VQRFDFTDVQRDVTYRHMICSHWYTVAEFGVRELNPASRGLEISTQARCAGLLALVEHGVRFRHRREDSLEEISPAPLPRGYPYRALECH
jgi:hypothetical protein